MAALCVNAADAPRKAGKKKAPAAGVPAKAEMPIVRGDKAAFTIKPAVKAANVVPFGVNIHPPTPRPWNEEPYVNAWNTMGSPEPLDVRIKIRLTGGGGDFIESKFARGQNPGLSYYNLYKDGFWDGGTVCIYRYENGKCRLVRQAKIKQSVCGDENSPNRATLADVGEPAAAGDECVLMQRRLDVPGAIYRPFEQKSEAFSWLEPAKGAAADRQLDGATAAPDGGSTASLKITLPQGETTLEQKFLGNADGWMRLREGATYVFSVWLKQEGMANGKLTATAGSLGSSAFDVGPQWRKYTFEFPAKPPTQAGEPLSLTATGPGTLWFDNFVVYEKCQTPPFEFYPEQIERLKSMRLSTLRIWALQGNKGPGVSLEAGLNEPFASQSGLEPRRAERHHAVGLHPQLDLALKIGADPWIITSTLFSAEEQQALIEYLAGPADSPWGARRAAMGRREPWTAAFKTLYIEMGNETWNGMFMPQGFPGRPEEYGAYTQLVFTAMTQSRHFPAGQVKFIVDGWTANTSEAGYGAKAAAACPLADFTDYAPYLGGWDVGGIADQGSDPAAVFNRLMLNDRMHGKALHDAADVVARMSKGRNKPLGNAVYEAGPGYSLPGPGKPIDPVEQANGKCLATAIAYFDQILSNQSDGYGPQCFFIYGNGNYWKSHNAKWDPHITTLGLALLNEHARGDMLEVTTDATPTADLPATQIQKEVEDKKGKSSTRSRVLPAVANVPLTRCFAFRDGKRLTVVLLSKQLDNATPVELKLPGDVAPKGTLYLIASASAMDHNIDGLKVKPQSRPIEVGQTTKLELPPHSMAVLVTETR